MSDMVHNNASCIKANKIHKDNEKVRKKGSLEENTIIF